MTAQSTFEMLKILRPFLFAALITTGRRDRLRAIKSYGYAAKTTCQILAGFHAFRAFSSVFVRNGF
jgi:hypothetical protein